MTKVKTETMRYSSLDELIGKTAKVNYFDDGDGMMWTVENTIKVKIVDYNILYSVYHDDYTFGVLTLSFNVEPLEPEKLTRFAIEYIKKEFLPYELLIEIQKA